MSNSIAKRSIALLTAVLVMTAFTFIITENASAASKKTYYLATKVVSKDSKGEVYQDDEYTYDKNGLLKEWNSLDTKRTYLRNSKGYLTTKKVSNDKGQKMTFKVTKRNKYGLPLDSVGAEQVDIYKYKGKIMRETTATTAKGETYEVKVDSHWNKTSEVMKDENGNVLYSATYKNTLYKSGKKKGLPKKFEATMIVYASGKKVTTHYTTKIKYKLNKHGKITKETQITTGDIKDKTVTKITYKKFKVPKKYRNLLLEWSVPWENR